MGVPLPLRFWLSGAVDSGEMFWLAVRENSLLTTYWSESTSSSR